MSRPQGTNIKKKDTLAKETINSLVSGNAINNSEDNSSITTTIRLPKDLKDEMTYIAKKKGLTNSAFIKLAISNLIDQYK